MTSGKGLQDVINEYQLFSKFIFPPLYDTHFFCALENKTLSVKHGHHSLFDCSGKKTRFDLNLFKVK